MEVELNIRNHPIGALKIREYERISVAHIGSLLQ